MYKKDMLLKREQEKEQKEPEQDNITDNKSNVKGFLEKEETSSKKGKVKNNVRDIIEQLKAKKNEREDLARQEKEAKEQSLMRVGQRKETIETEEKIDESELEREAEKIRQKEKRMEERRIAREKRKEKEFEEKRKKEE